MTFTVLIVGQENLHTRLQELIERDVVTEGMQFRTVWTDSTQDAPALAREEWADIIILDGANYAEDALVQMIHSLKWRIHGRPLPMFLLLAGEADPSPWLKEQAQAHLKWSDFVRDSTRFGDAILKVVKLLLQRKIRDLISGMAWAIQGLRNCEKAGLVIPDVDKHVEDYKRKIEELKHDLEYLSKSNRSDPNRSDET